MADFILCSIFGLLFAIIVLLLIKFNEYKSLTVRGKRVIFYLCFFVGYFIGLIALNINVNCDLQTTATTSCQVGWIK